MAQPETFAERCQSLALKYSKPAMPPTKIGENDNTLSTYTMAEEPEAFAERCQRLVLIHSNPTIPLTQQAPSIPPQINYHLTSAAAELTKHLSSQSDPELLKILQAINARLAVPSRGDFELFPKLVPEIRVTIWRYAALTPQILVVGDPRPDHQDQDLVITLYGDSSRHSLAQVSKEAHEEMKKVREKEFTKTPYGKVHVNMAHDVFWLKDLKGPFFGMLPVRLAPNRDALLYSSLAKVFGGTSDFSAKPKNIAINLSAWRDYFCRGINGRLPMSRIFAAKIKTLYLVANVHEIDKGDIAVFLEPRMSIQFWGETFMGGGRKVPPRFNWKRWAQVEKNILKKVWTKHVQDYKAGLAAGTSSLGLAGAGLIDCADWVVPEIKIVDIVGSRNAFR